MKRVNIFIILGIIAATLLIYPIGNSRWIPVGIRMGYVFCWFLAILGLIFLYEKLLDYRMRRLEKRLGHRCLSIYSCSVLEEHYMLDLDSCMLIGLFGFHPLHFQYLDAGLIDDVEIIVRKRNQYVAGAVVCRLHIQGKKCNIYLYRGGKMGLSILLKEYKELMDYADTIRNSLLNAGRISRERAADKQE